MSREVGDVDKKVAGPPANLIVGVVKAMRPRQWVKNILVAAAPLAALGTDVHHDWTKVLVKVAIAFVVFCLAASSIYLVNDVRDVEADRQHPTKRFRPIAAGIVPEWLAYTLAAVLGVISLIIAWGVNRNLALVMAVYIGMQLAYCFGLKHQAVIDVCIVSSAYLLRAIAGGAATDIPLSQWFLLTAAFASLFMVAGKRYAELQLAEHPQVAGELHQHLSAIRLDDVGHGGGGLLRTVGIRARPWQGRLVRGVDGAVHHRDPAVRG
jgi:decaprenyl-phosphate phosphoribosyltransferase